MIAASTPAPFAAITPGGSDSVRVEFRESNNTNPHEYDVDVEYDLTGAPEDQVLRSRFDDGSPRMRVRSRVTLDLTGDHELFSGHFAKLYRDARFEALRSLPPAPIAAQLAREALFDVARSGRSVFARLFLNQKYEEPVRGPDLDVERAVVAALGRAQKVVIHCAKRPVFPWAFVYDRRVETNAGPKNVEIGRFWGMSRVLQVESADTARETRLVAPLKAMSAICQSLLTPPVTASTADPFTSAPPDRLVGQSLTDVDDLRDALAALDVNAFYSLTHGSQLHVPAATTSCLMLGANAVNVSDLMEEPLPTSKITPVLVFLNACETSVLQGWDERSMPGYLVTRHHPRRLCYLGTSAEVPRLVAVDFARGFWERVLRGESVGSAVLETRREIYERSGNPLGLLYSLHGRAATRLG